MQELLNTLENDDDKETVAQGCEALTLLLPEIGAAAFSKHLQRLLELAFSLLEGQTTCQGDDDEDDEDEDHDQVLVLGLEFMDSVAEIVPKTPDSESEISDLKSQIPNPKPSTLNPQHSTLNTQQYSTTLNNTQQHIVIPNPKPQTPKPRC
jgi:hypothetical protein